MSVEVPLAEVKERLGRVALCHEWLTGAFGSDVTAAAIAKALDIRYVFTLVADRRVASDLFDSPVKQTWLGRLPAARRRWDIYLPLWTTAWRSLDLQQFDTVITSCHAFSNSVRLRPDALHVCYCYTPMRYAWLWRSEIRRVPAPLRPFWPTIAAALRSIDRRLSRRPWAYIAISRFVQDRIRRAYGRDSVVCHPPVDTEYFTSGPEPREDFYLYAGRLVDYKRPIEALLAAGQLRRRLVIAGDGPELSRLRRLAPPSLVDFRTRVSQEEMRSLMRRARALLFPGVEDFGIVMVEAQATGTPVIAQARGGAAEIVLHGETGVLYEGKGHHHLVSAIQDFERLDQPEWPGARENALRFSRTSFPNRLGSAVSAVLPR